VSLHQQLDQMATGAFTFQFDDVVISVIDEWADLASKSSIFVGRIRQAMSLLRTNSFFEIKNRRFSNQSTMG
jgi:hypothetical protein